VRNSIQLVVSFMQEFVLVSKSLIQTMLILSVGISGLSVNTPASAEAPRWQGLWEGKLENFPVRADAPNISVRREIGPWPEKRGACAALRTIYFEDGAEKGNKNYRLCRRPDSDALYVDEGGGVELSSRLLDDRLISTFKYGTTLLVSVIRVSGDMMEEDIYTARDQPATEGVLPLETRSLQRLILKRSK
jgi:hypothetical protein